MQAKFTVGTFGVIFDRDGRVLLCHRRDHDFWNLPGGQMDKGETPWDAGLREIREETGLVVTVSRLVGVYSKPERDDLVFVFVCRSVGVQLTLNDEADRLEFFSSRDMPGNTLPKHIDRIKDAAAKHAEPVLRIQTGPSPIHG